MFESAAPGVLAIKGPEVAKTDVWWQESQPWEDSGGIFYNPSRSQEK